MGWGLSDYRIEIWFSVTREEDGTRIGRIGRMRTDLIPAYRQDGV